jgi:DNA (cytosine-5)-methyltransferase 1
MAVQAVFGGELAWVADNDPGVAKILAARFPDVPNLGDITEACWAAVESVDILTAGFPCQDISTAGKRAGLRKGNRSGLWFEVARAITELRPSVVVIENVKELLSERADGDMEPCTWCLGDAGDERAMRALGAVLSDLATLGFDAEWTSLPAAGVGCCHRRWRVFVLAWRAAADARDRAIAQWSWGTWRQAWQWTPKRAVANGRGPVAGVPIAADTESLGRQRHYVPPPATLRGTHGLDLGPAIGSLLPTPNATDGQGGPRAVPERRTSHGTDHGPRLRDVAPALFKTPTAQLAVNGGSQPPGKRREGGHGPTLADQVEHEIATDQHGLVVDWQQYEAAVRRHEAVSGVSAPCPVEPGRTGMRLAPRFVEWMMTLPAGWVTSVPGLSRNAQLKALGNGVVPPQAELALRILLDRAAASNETAA